MPPERSRQLIGNVWRYVTAATSGGGGGDSQQPGVSVTFADLLAAPGFASAQAATDTEAPLTYTAVTPGINGNLILVTVAPLAPDTAETTASVEGSTITLTLESLDGIQALATQADVKAAIENEPAAAALVTCDVDSGGEATVYVFGDIYLASGQSKIVAATLADGDLVWDAQVFFPENFDAGTQLRMYTGPTNPLFYDGDPDPTDSADNTGEADVAVSVVSAQIFTLPIRATTATEVWIRAESEAGSVPSQGEMLLFVDVRTPSF